MTAKFLTPLLALLVLIGCGRDTRQRQVLRLATTTSTRDSGLLDLLIPPFEKEHDVRIDVIAVGTGKALKLGEAGDVDVVLVHARQAEDAFMKAGYGTRREDVMANRFELLGSEVDPAAIRDLGAPEALQQIAAGGFHFVSRDDDSGTHKRELQLWAKGGGKPEWSNYIETGQGMGATLVIANQMQAYVLSDRGTYLQMSAKLDLVPLAAPSAEMDNPYGIIVVKDSGQSLAHNKLAHLFVDYMTSPRVQSSIQGFQIAGESLFFPLKPTSAE
ncbi:MAG: substrate-binding domain-containing protein [Planctomycetales bacterium]|nr:substrate-binding domain-containing protein [Planctomycetales bacterium]